MGLAVIVTTANPPGKLMSAKEDFVPVKPKSNFSNINDIVMVGGSRKRGGKFHPWIPFFSTFLRKEVLGKTSQCKPSNEAMLKYPACRNNLSSSCSLLDGCGTDPPGNSFHVMFNVLLNNEHTIIKLTGHWEGQLLH